MMKEESFITIFENHPVLKSITDTIASDSTGRLIIDGLTGSSKAILIAKTFQNSSHTQMVGIARKRGCPPIFITI